MQVSEDPFHISKLAYVDVGSDGDARFLGEGGSHRYSGFQRVSV